MRGAVAVSAYLADITVEQGEDALTLYQFNTGAAKHYFCSRCGIYTFHQRRSRPHEYGVNVACIEGMSPFDFAEVPVNEGRTHPNDRPAGGSTIAGWLRYAPIPRTHMKNNILLAALILALSGSISLATSIHAQPTTDTNNTAATSQFELGLLYYNGRNFPQNFVKARTFSNWLQHKIMPKHNIA